MERSKLTRPAQRCNACIAIETRDTHRCIEGSTDCDCPICGDYLFTSPKKVVFMKCGHSIHKNCFDELLKSSYKCPLCSKSIVNMEAQWRQMDLAISGQTMPEEFDDNHVVILCNDCCSKSPIMFHLSAHKCAICGSYNTAVLRHFTEVEAVSDPSILQGFPMPRPALRNTLLQHAAHLALHAPLPPAAVQPQLPANLAAGSSTPAPSVSGATFGSWSPGNNLPLTLGQEMVAAAHLGHRPTGSLDTQEEDESEAEDIDFWGRDDSRNITSAESANSPGSHADSDGDSDDCEDDVEDEEEEEEDDEEEEEQINLFGHR
jgi:hypothetical protein